VWNTGRSGFDTAITTDKSKTNLAMMYDGSAFLPSSDSDSRPAGTPAAHSSQQQRKGFVPQRATRLQQPLPSPMIPPEGRQTEGQVQSLRREVEQLRVEMEAMRAGQHQPRTTEEPPPGYADS